MKRLVLSSILAAAFFSANAQSLSTGAKLGVNNWFTTNYADEFSRANGGGATLSTKIFLPGTKPKGILHLSWASATTGGR